MVAQKTWVISAFAERALPANMANSDRKTQHHQPHLEHLPGRVPVVVLLSLLQQVVGHQLWVSSQLVVPSPAMPPPRRHPLRAPHLMRVGSHDLGQGNDVRGQFDLLRVNGLGTTRCTGHTAHVSASCDMGHNRTNDCATETPSYFSVVIHTQICTGTHLRLV